MTISMTYRCEAYVAKVALFGAEVWGWKGAGVEKAEEKALCVLLRAHARTKPGFLPLSVEAAKLAFGFLLSILRNRYSRGQIEHIHIYVHERLTTLRLLDKWLRLLRASRSLLEAGERRFKKKLGRLEILLPLLPAVKATKWRLYEIMHASHASI